MKDETIKRIESAKNILEHLGHKYPYDAEMLEEQVASLEQVIENIELWWKE